MKILKTKYLNAKNLVRGKGNAVYGLAIDARENVYVPEYRHNRVLVFDSDLNERIRFDVAMPHGVTVDNDGFIYVMKYRAGGIAKFDSNGQEVQGWDSSLVKGGWLTMPIDGAWAGPDELVVLADYQKGIVIKIDARGSLVCRFQTEKAAKHGFTPHGVAINSDGIVYIADRKDIQRFTSDGKYLGPLGLLERNIDPLTVRIWKEKYLIVPDFKSNKILIMDLQGKLIDSFGRTGEREGEFLGVMNIQLSGDAIGYCSEEDGNRISKIDLEDVLKGFK